MTILVEGGVAVEEGIVTACLTLAMVVDPEETFEDLLVVLKVAMVEVGNSTVEVDGNRRIMERVVVGDPSGAVADSGKPTTQTKVVSTIIDQEEITVVAAEATNTTELQKKGHSEVKTKNLTRKVATLTVTAVDNQTEVTMFDRDV